MDRNDNKRNKIHLTLEGLESFKKELDSLKNGKRPKFVERLTTARNQGDLSENQEYVQAKEDLNLLDGRIAELEIIITKAVIINKKANSSQQVSLGSKVTVELDDQEIVFSLVGEWEANPSSQRISHKSPLGQKLVGKKQGEQVEVEAPIGKLVYKIVKIE